MFTLENVFEKRAEFENVCKDKSNSVSKELIPAKTEAEFLQVIFDNFYWVYMYVDKFGLEYDYVDNFNEGYAVVGKNNKFGFINKKFKEICKIKFDYVGRFKDGFARVRIGKRYGILGGDGKGVYGVKFTLPEVMKS